MDFLRQPCNPAEFFLHHPVSFGSFSSVMHTEFTESAFLPDSVDKFADTVRFLLLCTRLCTMFDISRRACQRSPLTNPVDEGTDYVFGLFSCAAFASGIVVSFGTVPEKTVSCASLVT